MQDKQAGPQMIPFIKRVKTGQTAYCDINQEGVRGHWREPSRKTETFWLKLGEWFHKVYILQNSLKFVHVTVGQFYLHLKSNL